MSRNPEGCFYNWIPVASTTVTTSRSAQCVTVTHWPYREHLRRFRLCQNVCFQKKFSLTRRPPANSAIRPSTQNHTQTTHRRTTARFPHNRIELFPYKPSRVTNRNSRNMYLSRCLLACLASPCSAIRATAVQPSSAAHCGIGRREIRVKARRCVHPCTLPARLLSLALPVLRRHALPSAPLPCNPPVPPIVG